jgi:hypothetical protein
LIFEKLILGNSAAEYFLYFFYQIYRENASTRLREFKIFGKFSFGSKLIPKILYYKRYNEFQNGDCLKDFVLWTIMEYAMEEFNGNEKTLKDISVHCIR